MWLWGSSNEQVLTGQIVATRGTTPPVDRHNSKHYLPATSLAGGKKTKQTPNPPDTTMFCTQLACWISHNGFV